MNNKLGQKFDFLFQGKIAPIFDDVAFIKGDIRIIVTEYEKWLNEQFDREKYLIEELVDKKFKDILLSLQPLNNYRKRIFIPTNSEWVVFTDSLLTAETSKIFVIAKRLVDIEVIQTKLLYKYYGHEVNGWGGGWFNYYRGFTPIRYVGLLYQDKWEFEQHGDPLPFEDLEKYKERLTRNKFTPQMLDSYLKHFGIDAFNENFYMPAGSSAYLIEMQRPLYANEKELTLEEARKELRYD